MAMEDLGIFRNLGGVYGLVLVPSDGVSMERAVELVANYEMGVCYIRTSRPDVKVIYGNNEKF